MLTTCEHDPRTRLTYPGGMSFDTSYWNNGAPNAVFEGDAGDPRIGLFSYDTLNRVTRYDAGASGQPGYTLQTFQYDPLSRVSSIANNLPAPSNSSDITIGFTEYSPASQITVRTRTNAAYAFDDDGANGTTGYVADDLNRYSQVSEPVIGAASLTYDGRGNLTSYNPGGTANDKTYEYDALNRMTSATVGGQTTTFTYDPLGRLHSIDGPVEDQRLLWDGDRIIAEYWELSGSTVRRRHVHAPGSLGAPLVTYVGGTVGLASRQYVQTDERGSVISHVNADDGTQATANRYGPYGEIEASGGAFGYAGQLLIREAGLFYMRARMYDPELGRFLQSDPIGYAGGINLYAYVGNDPTNFVDPLGLCPSGFRWENTRCVAIDPNQIRVTGQRGLRSDPAGTPEGQAAGRAMQRAADFGRIAGGERLAEPIIVIGIASPDADFPMSPASNFGFGNEQYDPNFILVQGQADHTRYIELDSLSYAHIFTQHAWFPFPNTSRFLEEFRNINSINTLVILAISRTTGIHQSANTIIYTANLGFNVGTDQSGILTQFITVVVRTTRTPGNGRVISAYPGN